MIYQVTYRAKNKTFYSDVEAKHYQDVLTFFNNVIGAEVQEIREYVYENKEKKDYSNFINKKIAVKFFNEDSTMNDIKIPLVKNTITDDEILSHIYNYFTIDNKKPNRAILKHI